MHSSLDTELLENVRHHLGKISARCPACAEDGRDSGGNHLGIFPNGEFACVVHPGEDGHPHRQRIFALIGDKKSRILPSDPKLLILRHKEQFRRRMGPTIDPVVVGRGLPLLERRFEWTLSAVGKDSPQDISSDLIRHDPRRFLCSLFKKDDLLWFGEVWDTGNPRHVKHWRTCGEIFSLTGPENVGPFTTPATWKQGCISRSAANVLAPRYTVLDFDEFNGRKPETDEEIEALKGRARAIIQWLRKDRGWQLAAILDTGHKSLHAWFHLPPDDVVNSLKAIHKPLGLDATLLGHPAQPCRLPGHRHHKSGHRSTVLWLQSPSW